MGKYGAVLGHLHSEEGDRGGGFVGEPEQSAGGGEGGGGGGGEMISFVLSFNVCNAYFYQVGLCCDRILDLWGTMDNTHTMIYSRIIYISDGVMHRLARASKYMYVADTGPD